MGNSEAFSVHCLAWDGAKAGQTAKILKGPCVRGQVSVTRAFFRSSASIWEEGEASVGHVPLWSLAGEQDFPFLVRDVRLFSWPSVLTHEGVRNGGWKPRVHRIHVTTTEAQVLNIQDPGSAVRGCLLLS